MLSYINRKFFPTEENSQSYEEICGHAFKKIFDLYSETEEITMASTAAETIKPIFNDPKSSADDLYAALEMYDALIGKIEKMPRGSEQQAAMIIASQAAKSISRRIGSYCTHTEERFQIFDDLLHTYILKDNEEIGSEQIDSAFEKPSIYACLNALCHIDAERLRIDQFKHLMELLPSLEGDKACYGAAVSGLLHQQGGLGSATSCENVTVESFKETDQFVVAELMNMDSYLTALKQQVDMCEQMALVLKRQDQADNCMKIILPKLQAIRSMTNDQLEIFNVILDGIAKTASDELVNDQKNNFEALLKHINDPLEQAEIANQLFSPENREAFNALKRIPPEYPNIPLESPASNRLALDVTPYKLLPKDAQSESFIEEIYLKNQVDNGLVHFQKNLGKNGRICCKPDDYADIRSALIKLPWLVLGNVNRAARFIVITKTNQGDTQTMLDKHGNANIFWNMQQDGEHIDEQGKKYFTHPAETLCAEVFNAYNKTLEIRQEQEDPSSPHFNPSFFQPVMPRENDFLGILPNRLSTSGDIPSTHDQGQFHLRDGSSVSSSSHHSALEEIEKISSVGQNIGIYSINNGPKHDLFKSDEIQIGHITNCQHNHFMTRIDQNNTDGNNVFYLVQNDKISAENLPQFYQDLENYKTTETLVKISTQTGNLSITPIRQHMNILISQNIPTPSPPVVPTMPNSLTLASSALLAETDNQSQWPPATDQHGTMTSSQDSSPQAEGNETIEEIKTLDLPVSSIPPTDPSKIPSPAVVVGGNEPFTQEISRLPASTSPEFRGEYPQIPTQTPIAFAPIAQPVSDVMTLPALQPQQSSPQAEQEPTPPQAQPQHPQRLLTIGSISSQSDGPGAQGERSEDDLSRQQNNKTNINPPPKGRRDWLTKKFSADKIPAPPKQDEQARESGSRYDFGGKFSRSIGLEPSLLGPVTVGSGSVALGVAGTVLGATGLIMGSSAVALACPPIAGVVGVVGGAYYGKRLRDLWAHGHSQNVHLGKVSISAHNFSEVTDVLNNCFQKSNEAENAFESLVGGKGKNWRKKCVAGMRNAFTPSTEDMHVRFTWRESNGVRSPFIEIPTEKNRATLSSGDGKTLNVKNLQVCFFTPRDFSNPTEADINKITTTLKLLQEWKKNKGKISLEELQDNAPRAEGDGKKFVRSLGRKGQFINHAYSIRETLGKEDAQMAEDSNLRTASFSDMGIRFDRPEASTKPGRTR